MIDLSTIEYILLFLHERYHCCFSNEGRTELKYSTENIRVKLFMSGLLCSIQFYCEFSNCGILGKRIPIACDFKTNMLAIIPSLLSSLSTTSATSLSLSLPHSLSLVQLSLSLSVSLFFLFLPLFLSLSLSLLTNLSISLSFLLYFIIIPPTASVTIKVENTKITIVRNIR